MLIRRIFDPTDFDDFLLAARRFVVTFSRCESIGVLTLFWGMGGGLHKKGEFAMFPTHVCRQNELLTWAEAREFLVVSKRTVINNESWEQVAAAGTLSQIVAFLSSKSLNEIDLSLIVGRLKARKDEWSAVLSVLDSRAWFDARIKVLGLVHRDFAQAKLGLSAWYRGSVGPRLECPLMDYCEDGMPEEISEIINARAHKLGDGLTMTNERLAA